ncbi:hypothetical protein B0H11DRAFT_1954276 [Mycena galericulata]|nr:hypothetical protein B0H11DRAFT_1954276 [Mycena galericulata]
MKALDIHSEGAAKLLAELLDLDAPGPYEEGGRHRNAERFTHRYTRTCAPRTGRVVQVTMSAKFKGAFARSRSLWNEGSGSKRTRMIRQRVASVGHRHRYRYCPSRPPASNAPRVCVN